MASERIEKWIGLDKGNVVSVAFLVSFLKKAECFLFLPSAYADAEIVLLITGANLSPEVLRRAVT